MFHYDVYVLCGDGCVLLSIITDSPLVRRILSYVKL
jgi:hypothetical protein